MVRVTDHRDGALVVLVGHTGVGDAGTDAQIEGTEAQWIGHQEIKRSLVSH